MQRSKVSSGERAAVASEHPLASLAGCDALKKGGNAFDAAVATSFTLAVTQHHIGGLGGDFFATFFEAKTGKVHCLNSSGWAPSGLTLDLVRSKGEAAMPKNGPLSCVVPGQVAGVWEMHKKFGRLEFASLLKAPASNARDGFKAGPGLCRSIGQGLDHFSREAREIFAPTGRPPNPGDPIIQTSLARTIDEVASGGAEAFYGGWPSERIRDTLRDQGVHSDASDFREFRPEWVGPLALDYRGTKVYETPPNSMGATTLLILRLLSEHDLRGSGPLSRKRIDLTMEAAETAYARRDRTLGDPRYCRIDMDEFMSTTAPREGFLGQVKDGDTTAFSIADEEGNLVSAIQSLFHHFGSRVFVPGCGLMLNSRASGFRMAGPNTVGPRRRPLHTLSPLLIERDGTDRIAIGTSGGDYRPIQHAQFVTDLVDYSMTLEQTVEHPRFVWREGRSVVAEEGFEAPSSPNYEVQWVPGLGKTGVCHAVELRDHSRTAVCDSRGDGMPAGY